MDHATHHGEDSHDAQADPHRAPLHDSEHGGHGAHDKHAGHDPEAFRRQFWVLLALTIPVLIWSEEVEHWLGYTAPVFPGSEWIPPVLGTIIFLYGGRVFLSGARTELGDRQPGMMTLITLAIVVAFVASWAATLGVFEVEVCWELATLITVMSLGHWLEMRSIVQAQGALKALAELLPETAERIRPEGVETVPKPAMRNARPGSPAVAASAPGHTLIERYVNHV